MWIRVKHLSDSENMGCNMRTVFTRAGAGSSDLSTQVTYTGEYSNMYLLLWLI